MLASAAQAGAQDLVAERGSLISEARLGVYAHNVEDYGEFGAAASVQALFQPLPGRYDNALADVLLTPRPHVGLHLNLDGNTSLVYTGLSWTKNLGRLFIEGEFGLALHNGKTGSEKYHDRAEMGCRWAFHEAFSVGVNLDADWRVLATIEHFSNAGLCSNNSGLTNAGLRIGRLF